MRVNGWVAFAATMMLLAGVFNILHGLVSWFRPGFFATSEGNLLLFGFTGWGVLLTLWGILMVVTAFSLLSGATWARVLTIAVVGVNAVAQLAFLNSFPWWSAIMIALDVLAIYGLTARWPATAAAGPGERAEGSGISMPEQRSGMHSEGAHTPQGAHERHRT
ncbi:DUF7144 family membrane protein [Marinactinospora thermotolerans]|uniref:DUF7144 domain-containing protein n=1 Tax=Marinactinospora thermotolerans DSM 45154 TaxID=1122192 RepID=A0A1T4R1E1_9ACTN|nr:hypothetical protein [Marinactinospora thermotolerans]SKA09418.1 hypothetical protein SAMN02745673_02413 [Marinactinospora thermotolerans DSM 45154]